VICARSAKNSSMHLRTRMEGGAWVRKNIRSKQSGRPAPNEEGHSIRESGIRPKNLIVAETSLQRLHGTSFISSTNAQ